MNSIVRRSGFSLLKSHNSSTSALVSCRSISSTKDVVPKNLNTSGQIETHTGHAYTVGDYRNVRFTGLEKHVNRNFAVDLIAEQPVIVCETRVVASDSGGKLGHPRVFINLDAPGPHVCLYSGQRFVHKKHYNEVAMGPSISYKDYVDQH